MRAPVSLSDFVPAGEAVGMTFPCQQLMGHEGRCSPIAHGLGSVSDLCGLPLRIADGEHQELLGAAADVFTEGFNQ